MSIIKEVMRQEQNFFISLLFLCPFEIHNIWYHYRWPFKFLGGFLIAITIIPFKKFCTHQVIIPQFQKTTSQSSSLFYKRSLIKIFFYVKELINEIPSPSWLETEKLPKG